MGVVVPQRHPGVETHLRHGLNPSVVDAVGRAEANLGGNVVGDDRRLVMAGTTGLAHRQIDGVANHVDVFQAVDLQGLVVGR
jgi:hypothetical protein